MRPILLIDLSSLAHPIFHMSGSEPDPNWISTQIVARVRSMATNQPHVAIACDSGRSFRKDIDATYKSNRPEHDATLQHQISLATDILKRDGFPIWAAKGYEADDVLATATAHALTAGPDVTVTIATADKDLLQLINGRVTAKSLKDGATIDIGVVVDKLGVKPEQVRDWLSLVGDTSDNVIGCKGIGPKTATRLLTQFGSLDELYATKLLPQITPGITPSIVTNLKDFQPRLKTVRELLTLRTDAPIPFDEIWRQRVSEDTAMFMEDDPLMQDINEALPMFEVQPQCILPDDGPGQAPTAKPVAVQAGGEKPSAANGGDVGASKPVTLEVLPADFEHQLEPHNFAQAKELATWMFQSKLFSAWGTPQAVLAIILAGRELGLAALASLRGFHAIDSKPAMAADLMRALVVRSGRAKYFMCQERTADKCTYETHRRGDPSAVTLTYTMEQAKRAWQKDERAWLASGWGRHPEDMLSARASAKLARLVYADILAGLYAVEELEE